MRAGIPAGFIVICGSMSLEVYAVAAVCVVFATKLVMAVVVAEVYGLVVVVEIVQSAFARLGFANKNEDVTATAMKTKKQATVFLLPIYLISTTGKKATKNTTVRPK